jgi:hypothetical protein
MSDLFYLSDENRQLIDQMERQRKVVSHAESLLLEQRIQILRKQEKHYSKCNAEELSELRSQLADKIGKLAMIGKRERAAPFQQYVQLVDLRARELAMEEARLAKERRDQAQKEALEVHDKKAGTDNAAPRTGRARWTTGVDPGGDRD